MPARSLSRKRRERIRPIALLRSGRRLQRQHDFQRLAPCQTAVGEYQQAGHKEIASVTHISFSNQKEIAVRSSS